MTVAFVTTSSARRLEQIVAWVEDELEQISAEAYAELLLFSFLDPGRVAPEALFFQPHWRQPFVAEPVALLEPPKAR